MPEQTEGFIEISATAREVMEVIADFDAYPEWAEGIRKAEVKRRDSKGRPAEVAFEVSQMGIGAKYTLAYRYRAKDGGLSWTTRSASGGYDGLVLPVPSAETRSSRSNPSSF